MTEVIEDLQDSDPSLVDRVRVRDLDTELPAGIRRLSPGRLDIDIDAIVRIARNKLAQFDRTE
jgi:hypothetical protein